MDRKEFVKLLAQQMDKFTDDELDEIYDEAKSRQEEEQEKRRKEKEKDFMLEKARDDMAYSMIEYQLALGYIDLKDYEDEETYDEMFANVVEQLKEKERKFDALDRLIKIFS